MHLPVWKSSQLCCDSCLIISNSSIYCRLTSPAFYCFAQDIIEWHHSPSKLLYRLCTFSLRKNRINAQNLRCRFSMTIKATCVRLRHYRKRLKPPILMVKNGAWYFRVNRKNVIISYCTDLADRKVSICIRVSVLDATHNRVGIAFFTISSSNSSSSHHERWLTACNANWMDVGFSKRITITRIGYHLTPWLGATSTS